MLSDLISWFESLSMEVKLNVFYRQILAYMGILPWHMAMGSAGLEGILSTLCISRTVAAWLQRKFMS